MLSKLKKAFAIVLCLTMVFSLTAFGVDAAMVSDGSNFYLFCDGNSDQEINIKDLIRMKKYIADSDHTEIAFVAADSNADGELNGTDLSFLRGILLGNDVEGHCWSEIY